MSNPSTPQPPPGPPSCYRHPGRATQVRCTRCDRYICPDCMQEAAVGHQCPSCVQQGAATGQPVRQPRLQYGAATPVLSYALITINVLVFIAQHLSPELTEAWVLWGRAVARDGQLYRLFTSAFLHLGLMHLLFNMWALYVVGPPLEAWLGRWRFGALYALSALGGSTLIYLLSPTDAVTAGASAAVFGLFGAVFVVANRLDLDVRWVAGLIVINLVITFVVPHISWQGHVGGLVTGTLIAAAYVYAPQERRNLVQLAASAATAGLFAALIWWRTAELLHVS